MFNILAEKLSYLFLLSSLFIGKICVNVVKIFSWLIPNPTIKKDFLFFCQERRNEERFFLGKRRKKEIVVLGG